MKKRKSRLLIILLSITCILSGLYLYIDKIFLPVQLKRFVLEQTKSFLKRDIQLGSIKYYPLKGIIMEDVTIMRNDGSQLPLLKVEEINFTLFLPALLKEKSIVIPSMTLRNAYIHLIHEYPKEWNINDLLTRARAPKNSNSPDVFLGSLILQNARVEITDEVSSPDQTVVFTPVQGRANISLTKQINFNLTADIPKAGSQIELKGGFRLKDKRTKAALKISQAELVNFLPFLDLDKNITIRQAQVDQLNLTLNLTKSLIDLEGQLSGAFDLSVGEKTLQGRILSEKFKIRKDNSVLRLAISEPLLINDALLSFGNDTILKGKFSSSQIDLEQQDNVLSVKGQCELKNSDIQFGRYNHYQGDLLLNSVLFTRGNNSWDLQLRDAASLKTEMSVPSFGLIKGNAQNASVAWKSSKKSSQIKTQFDLNQTDISLSQDRSLTGNLRVRNTDVSIDSTRIKVNTEIGSENLTAQWKKDAKLTGVPFVSLEASFDRTERTPAYFSGMAVFTSASITGLPEVEQISQLQGTLLFSPLSLETDSLTFEAQGSPIKIKGKVDGYRATPILDIQSLAQRINFSRWPIVADLIKNKFHITTSGEANAAINFKGVMTDLQEAVTSAQIGLIKAQIESDKLTAPIQDISGEITYEDNLVTWKNLQASYQGTRYQLEGNLKDFFRPIVETNVSFKGIDISTRLKFLKGTISVTDFKGHFKDSTLTLKGEIYPKKELSLSEGMLKGSADFLWEDLTQLPFPIQEKIIAWKLKGKTKATFSGSGSLAAPNNLVFSLSGTSPMLSIQGQPVSDILFTVAKDPSKYTNATVNGSIYGGNLIFESFVDSTKKDLPSQSTIVLNGLRLENLQRDKKKGEEKSSGSLSMQAELRGPFKNTKQLEGTGSLHIRDGNIWNINLLNGLWGALLIPEFTNIVFTEADADFKIKDKKIFTENLVMQSRVARLEGKGWIDFNKNINFTVIPKFRETELLRSSSLKKGLSSILTQTTGYINILITGTVKHPQYKTKTIPIKVIEKATGALWEGVQGILEEMIPTSD